MARLDHNGVLDAAEALLDDVGFEGLTMTSLAGALGVRVSSLYNHVANLEDLRAELQLRAMQQLGAELSRAAMGRVGVDGLRAMAEAVRVFALAHPHRYWAMTQVPADHEAFLLASVTAGEALEVMLRTAGVPAEQVRTSQLALFSAVHGHLSLEVSGFFGRVPALDDVYAQVVRGAIAAAVLDPGRGSAAPAA
jgi:AcrR family transcriptional regulator